ncbi:MAG: ABC transporter substrate-binding protein/permease [Candidatus Omnitrophica bacterium]|nr:ABC transporter substrate-binding protein/permease [Candidatus Omnitrophota bacterium]MCF7876779.1 ABC transporter substrate-binding protein/permease [Candidatus Omnitrophota bacterium]MCF7878225.1 ABC transporter substrate-binding protein/permease [Candidatus Omnitrophota bacterium]
MNSFFSKSVKFIFIALIFSFLIFPAESAEKETFTVALTGKYPPFSFYSKEGKLVGFDVDVAKKIAEYMGQNLEIVTTEWDGILAGLLSEKYDAIIGSMAITPQRKKSVDFSLPYYTSGAQLFIHQDDKDEFKTIKNLTGKKVGVGLGETYQHFLEKNYPQIKVIAYKSTVDIFQDLLNGRIKGFVIDRLVGLYQIKKANAPFRATGRLLYKERIAIPVIKERKALLAKINKALIAMKKKGELDEINQKWFGEGRETAQSQKSMEGPIVIKKLLQGFGITLFVAFSSIIMGFFISIPFGVILNKRKIYPLYLAVRTFNDFIRGTPLLIQLFFVYFGAPQVGITLTPIQAAIFTLTVNTSAYMAEVIRSGLMSVNPGQRLAGKALGLTNFSIFRYIVWPQAFRIALPPLMNAVVALMKDTALIAMISVGEVIREAQSIISVTYNPMKYYFIAAVMFFAVTFPLMKIAGRIERKIKKKGFSNA